MDMGKYDRFSLTFVPLLILQSGDTHIDRVS
jgi:hypothetical protein